MAEQKVEAAWRADLARQTSAIRRQRFVGRDMKLKLSGTKTILLITI